MSAFWIDVEDASGTRQGSGPIVTAQSWTRTARLSKSGNISFPMPLADDRSALPTALRVVRCKSLRNGQVVELGVGIVDSRDTDVQGRMLTVSGPDLLDELTYRTVGSLLISDGSGGPTTNALSPIMALAPSGWTLDTVTGHDHTLTAVYQQFQDETVLEALISIANKTGEWFRLGAGRTVIWGQKDAASSSVRAIAQGEPVVLEGNPDVCIITSLRPSEDSHALASRIIPYGSGNAEARLTLASTTRTAPAGYTLDKSNNFIRYDSNESTTGPKQRKEYTKTFADVVAASDSSSDTQTAANQLFDVALLDLQANINSVTTYEISLVGVEKDLNPGDTIRVVYHVWVDSTSTPGTRFHALSVDGDFVIQEATVTHDAQTRTRVHDLTVTPTTAQLANDTNTLIGALARVKAGGSHVQPAAKSQNASSLKTAGATTGQIPVYDGSGTTVPQTISGAGGVPSSRLINTTAPITGGGDLSADRTLALTTGTSPAAVTLDAAASSGTAATVARDAHSHRLDTYSSAAAATTPAAVSAAGTAGTAPSRGDHTHQSPGGVYSLTSNQSATNATTVLTGATWTVPAGFGQVGTVIELWLAYRSAKTTSPPTLTIALKIAGSTVLTGTITQVSSATAGSGWLRAVITIVSTGAGGMCMPALMGGYSQGNSVADALGANIPTTTSALDTTATQQLDLQINMTTAVASNTLTVTQGYVGVLKI